MYDPGSIWNHRSQIDFQRTRSAFHAVIENMIRLASECAIVIDAYGWTKDSITMLQTIINSLHHGRIRPQLPRVSLFYKEGNSSPDAQYVKEQIVNGLDVDGRKIDFGVFALREVAGSDVFHNRCILTELGGIMIGHGIGVPDNPAHTDEATLMHPDVYIKKWRQFVDERRFEVVSHAESN